MHITHIPKGNGKYRTIYAPNIDEKAPMQALLPYINAAALQADTHGVAHAFMTGRSIVTNALAHAGDWQITISFDFSDFFDSVTPDMVQWEPTKAQINSLRYTLWNGLTWEDGAWHTGIEFVGVKNRLFPDGAARQGLPTSPALANLAAAPFDSAVIALGKHLTPKRRILGKSGPAFVYTRYADDLTFSTNSEKVAQNLLHDIPMLAAAHGFQINPTKTRRQHARAGYRIVTGIAVTPTGILPSRFHRRKLRAASHQIRKGICRRNLRRILSKITERYARNATNCMDVLAIGDSLRAQWRGLAGHIRLIPPKNPTFTTTQPATTIKHNPLPATSMPFGAFNRKITA